MVVPLQTHPNTDRTNNVLVGITIEIFFLDKKFAWSCYIRTLYSW